MPARMKRLIGVVTVVGAALAFSGCAPKDPATEQFLSGANSGYISDLYQVVSIPEADRGEPIAFKGESERGAEIDSANLIGNVVVVNFWYTGCGPCRIEAPILEDVHQKYQDQGVSFIGVNTSDLADTALAFADTYAVTYPSIIDVKTGDVELAFAAAGPMTSTPITIVLDKQGRAAARIIGAVPDAAILGTLVRELTEES